MFVESMKIKDLKLLSKQIPNIEDLEGYFKVKGYGLLRPLIGNYKRIGETWGYNYMPLINRKWGMFEKKQDLETVRLEYKNSKIVDYIEKIDDDHYFGSFYYKGKFIGNFTLTRAKVLWFFL